MIGQIMIQMTASESQEVIHDLKRLAGTSTSSY